MNNLSYLDAARPSSAGADPLVIASDVATVLRNLMRDLRGLQEQVDRATSGEASQPRTVDLHATCDTTLQLDVKRARNLRRLRKNILGEDYFSGSAWDILLHLFESYAVQRRDTIGNVCDGAEIAGTTGLRWIIRLEQQGLISVNNDILDGRRRFVVLSNSGVEKMMRYFSGVAPHLIAA